MSLSSILLGCRRANSSIALGISRAKSRWTARKLSSDKRAPDIDERNVVFVRFSPLNDLSAEHVVTGRKLIVHNWLVCRGVLEHEKHHARYASELGWWSVAIGKSIEWLCMEDCHSVKLSRLLALTVLVLNGSLFRNLTIVSYWASPDLHCFFFCAFSGSSWADTPSYRNVLYPAGPCSY